MPNIWGEALNLSTLAYFVGGLGIMFEWHLLALVEN
jgi:hypothetical protein